MTAPIDVVLAPYATRFHGPGMEDGPDAVASLLDGSTHRVPFDLDAPVPEALAGGLPSLADAIAAATRPLALLGECTLAPAVAGGLMRVHPDLTLLWIDAHGDLNTPATTPSGFLGGMPFAILLGWCHDEVRLAAGQRAPLAEERCALVGARELDPGERAALDASLIVESPDVTDALARLPVGPIWVHLDGDVLDPDVAPGVDFPVADGWSVSDAVVAIDTAVATGRVVGVSACCGNPRRDPDGRGARAYVTALASFLGVRCRA